MQFFFQQKCCTTSLLQQSVASCGHAHLGSAVLGWGSPAVPVLLGTDHAVEGESKVLPISPFSHSLNPRLGYTTRCMWAALGKAGAGLTGTLCPHVRLLPHSLAVPGGGREQAVM